MPGPPPCRAETGNLATRCSPQLRIGSQAVCRAQSGSQKLRGHRVCNPCPAIVAHATFNGTCADGYTGSLGHCVTKSHTRDTLCNDAVCCGDSLSACQHDEDFESV